jgi:hypothetical protein
MDDPPRPLPTPEQVAEIVASIEAVIGLGASFPMEKAQISTTADQEAEYVRLRGDVVEGLARLAETGIYVPHLNNHTTLRGLWAWAITSIPGGSHWGARRDAVWRPYADTLAQLASLQEDSGPRRRCPW